MRTFRWILPSVAALALAVGGTQSLHAQSATSGAITGTVTDPSGAPIEGAQVQVRSTATGSSLGAVVRDNGRYLVQGLEVGPGYSVTVRRIGFAPQTKENVTVNLGLATRVDFSLSPQTTVLSTVQITDRSNESIISPTKTGVGATISDSSLRRLPTLNRNFTDFVRLTPQVTSSPTGGGVSAGGAPARLNQIQIDGASANDVFGLASTGGQPGAQASGHAINLEAVKEYQVLLTPFDIRQGNFTGALINAVTKGGTNQFHGSAVAFHRNQDYGRNVPLLRSQNFLQDQYEFSLGGPILKDRLFFFLAPSFQNQQSPASGPYQGQSATSQVPFVVADTIQTRFRNILQNQYNIDLGDAGSVTNENPLRGLFSRVDANFPGINSRLVVRNNYQKNSRDSFSRSTALTSPTFAFSSNSFAFDNKVNQSVLQFYTNWANGANNEFILGYNQTRDRRLPAVMSPSITVDVRSAPTTVAYRLLSGADASSQANQLDQDVFEFTDNVSKPFGAHTVTVGTQNRFYKIRNLFAQNLFGTYTFFSLDSLAAGRPTQYNGAVSQGADLAARFKASSYSAYAQDVWNVTSGFNLTAGLRLDMPVVNSTPFYNNQVDSIFHQRTDELPGKYVQYSPRVGFNWDVTGDQRNQLRGGVGSFAGSPSFVFISNAFGNTGAGVTQVSCGRATDPGGLGKAPNFSGDINNQPKTCLGGGSFVPYNQGGPIGAIATIDKDFKYPQSLRASLGYDRALTPTLTLTLEGLYSHAIYSPFYINDNLGARFTDSEGRVSGLPIGKDRNGRVVYGSIGTTGAASPTLITSRIPAASGLIRLTNENLDYSYSYTTTLDKRFSNGVNVRGSYTYGHSYDVASLTSDVAASNFRFGRTLSTRANTDKYLGRSVFDSPHRILVSGSYTVKPTKTDISMIYDGRSGSPYDYVYASGSATGSGDLNADGFQGNDLVYVPKDVTDPNEIRFRTRLGSTASAADTAQDVRAQQSALERLIETTPCLRDSRGKIMERNSCRNPWQNDVQVSLRQSLPSFRGHNLSVQLDVFNFLNLLNERWGQLSDAGANSQVNLLTHQGQIGGTGTNPLLGATGSQGIFTYGSAANPNPAKYTSNTKVGSNYRFQLGARYAF